MKCNMHLRAIAITVLVLIIATVSSSPASILDLISWDETEPEKREDSSNGVAQKSCVCNGPSCVCCVDFNMTFVDLGGPGCVRMKYLSQEDGIAVNVSYGDSLLHSEQVKGPNPKPACISLLANIAEVCASFSNLHPVENSLKGCLKLEPKLLGDVQTQFDVGCFIMGSDGMKLDTTINSTLITKIETGSKNESQAESEEFTEEELLATVNETAEQGLAFLGNWLGIFDKSDDNSTESEKSNTTVQNQSRKLKKFNLLSLI